MVKMAEERIAPRRLSQAVAPPRSISSLNPLAGDGADKGPPIDSPTKASKWKQGALTGERERLMIEHLPMVRFMARRMHERLPQHVPIEDLYSAGVVGLLEAHDRFDPSKGGQIYGQRSLLHRTPAFDDFEKKQCNEFPCRVQ